MSDTDKSYSPFSSEGRYNLETYLYNHKKNVLGFVILFISLLVGLAFFVWYSGLTSHDISSSSSFKPPPPKYGYGPYGYGLYAPPRELFENPPAMMD